jgi:hypothetical protein
LAAAGSIWKGPGTQHYFETRLPLKPEEAHMKILKPMFLRFHMFSFQSDPPILTLDMTLAEWVVENEMRQYFFRASLIVKGYDQRAVDFEDMFVSLAVFRRGHRASQPSSIDL